MSRGTVQRKLHIKKLLERHSPINDRISDDEINRRRPCYQLIQKEKEKQCSLKKDNNKINNQMDILREILFHNPDINELIKRSSKTDITRTGKNHSIKKEKVLSTKALHSADMIDSNPSEEDHASVHSADEEVIESEPIGESHLNRKNIQQNAMTRSSSVYSESRHQANGGIRTLNSVSTISDRSKHEAKSTSTEQIVNGSSDKLKKLLDRLSLELNDLESRTGFKSNTNILSSHTCSTALAMALLSLTGHVKQCMPSSKRNQEMHHLKDQLSFVIKNQIDFQKKIENQMNTLQTMMQTICQLINNEIITNKNSQDIISLKKNFRDQNDYEEFRTHQNWSTNPEKPEVNNVMNELLKFSRRMNNGTPSDNNSCHQHTNNRNLAYTEILDATKKPPRPPSSISAHEANLEEISKQIQQHKIMERESRSSLISPIDTPSSYDIFESGLANRNSSASRLRNEIEGYNGTSTNTVSHPSISETLLEKILQERLRLVQHISELSKQHEMTQEELANLQTKS